MDEYLNSRQKEIFHNLLANPADTGSAYTSSLQELVRSYPQSGLFRALYGRALNDKNPATAGAYFDSRALFKLYHQPDNLLAIDGSQVILQPESLLTVVAEPADQEQAVTETNPLTAEEATEVLKDQPLDFPEILNVPWMHNQEDVKEDAPPQAEETSIAEPVAEEPEPAITQQEIAPVIEEQTAPAPVTTKTETNIDDEVFEEITGIDDIEIVQNPADISAAPVAANEAIVEREETPAPERTESRPVTDEAEKLILGNIAATDYFVFDKAFGDNRKPASETAPAPEPEAQPAFVATPQETPAVSEPVDEENTHQDVSKYHDEKMPYTFMWWLDKTRKEHGNLYQPYTKAPVGSPVGLAKKPVNDALQQQYFENIFHISSVDDLSNDAAAQTIEFDMHRKEDRIIQRFITEDPQIHPPAGEKLDTENKAKKSSEDNNEMVTETLARIYADQMLYPKAIATYKKLMLKFPEKSRYFASRIENLEKKTN